MSSTDAVDQKTINENLENRFGRDYKNTLLENYESSYLTSDDFAKFKELGMSVLRVPFTYMNLYEKNDQGNWKLKSNAFTRLDWIVDQCSEQGIYTILDLHGAFGSQNGQDHSGQAIDEHDEVPFYNDYTLRQQTLDLWREVATRYNGNPAVAGYDILNEPGEHGQETKSYHWDYYNEIYNTIRSIDQDHIIIMESCWWARNLPQPSQYGWQNVVYSFHHYDREHQTSVDEQKTAADNLINDLKVFNVPIYIGEYTLFELDEAWSYVLNLFNINGYHHTSWSYKSNNMGTWGIYDQKGTEKVNPLYTDANEILRIWGPSVVGTGSTSYYGMVYNKMRENLPGTVFFMKNALENKNYFTLKVLNTNKYVSADEYGMSQLRANRDAIGTWEHFFMYNNDDGTVSIQSRANNKFLCSVFDNWDG
ncbi:MAG: cellulase family glycosylhydrolase, partial [Clostridia bacterium]|nr:cellulase family glycosylhydrolase [Clostridia bacterium]